MRVVIGGDGVGSMMGGYDGCDVVDVVVGEEEGTTVMMGLTLLMVRSASRCCCCCCCCRCIDNGVGDGCCGIIRLGCGCIDLRRCLLFFSNSGKVLVELSVQVGAWSWSHHRVLPAASKGWFVGERETNGEPSIFQRSPGEKVNLTSHFVRSICHS